MPPLSSRAQQHVAFEHLRTNIFESDTGFDKRQAIGCAHFVHHRSRRQRLHHTPTALSIHNQMMQQQAYNLVCSKRVAMAIHAANTVGITIGHRQMSCGCFLRNFWLGTIIFLNWLGINSTEQNIVSALSVVTFAGRAPRAIVQSNRRLPPKSASCAEA